MKIVQLTTHDGRKAGLPALSAVMMVGCEAKPNPEFPKATSMVRFVTGAGARHIFLRESLKHLLNLFPRAIGGAGWVRSEDGQGNEVAFPENSIRAFEEQAPKDDDEEGAKPRFWVQLGCETGPIELVLRCDFKELMTLMGESAPDPAAARESDTDGLAAVPPHES